MSASLELEARAFVATATVLAQFPPAPPPTLPGHIAAWLADRIQFGDLKPGDPIRELAVAEHFDVSRGPVRDALRMLNRDGLVDINGRKGASVRGLSEDEIDALFRIRAELFARLCGLAAARGEREPGAVAALCQGAHLLVRLADDPATPVGDYMTTRRAISALIASLAGNLYMSQVSAAREREVAVLWASVLNPERRKRSAASWVTLCQAVTDADAAQAEQLGRDLVLDGLAEIKRRGGR